MRRSIRFLAVSILASAFMTSWGLASNRNPDFYLYLQNADVRMPSQGTYRDPLTIDYYVNGETARPRLQLDVLARRGGQGIMTSFSENPTSRDRVVLTFTTTRTTPAGIHQFTLRARGAGLTRTQNFTITILPSSTTSRTPLENQGTGGSSGRPRTQPGAGGAGGSSAIGGTGSSVSAPPTPQSPSIPLSSVVDRPAFPGAVGFGARASGGRHGDVCIVTNLSTSGPGSFQGCIDTAVGPRTIVFRVSGVIPGDIQITQKNLTIAGQTSPKGIIVRGLHTTEEPYCDQDASCLRTAKKAENLIIRHIRSRGWEDGLRLRAARNVIVDHGSFENATDENGEFSFSNNITVMNSVFGEGIGNHLYNGTLFNYSEPTVGLELDRITMAYNAWNRVNERFPELSRESPRAAQTTMNVELINNLLWDQSFPINVWDTTISGNGGADDAPNRIYYRLNWIGNYSVTRPDYRMGMIHMNLRDGNSTTLTRTYFRDNHMRQYASKSDYDLNYCCNDFGPGTEAFASPMWASETPLMYESGPYGLPISATRILDSRTEVPRSIFKSAGAFPRDALDQRLMTPVCTGVILNEPRNVNRYGDTFAIADDTTHFPADTDNDGMPDAWESAHGLDPRGPSDANGHLLDDGYTNLEMYLNELSENLVSNETSTQDISRCTF